MSLRALHQPTLGCLGCHNNLGCHNTEDATTHRTFGCSIIWGASLHHAIYNCMLQLELAVKLKDTAVVELLWPATQPEQRVKLVGVDPPLQVRQGAGVSGGGGRGHVTLMGAGGMCKGWGGGPIRYR